MSLVFADISCDLAPYDVNPPRQLDWGPRSGVTDIYGFWATGRARGRVGTQPLFGYVPSCEGFWRCLRMREAQSFNLSWWRRRYQVRFPRFAYNVHKRYRAGPN
jgi:hypothetical protein